MAVVSCLCGRRGKEAARDSRRLDWLFYRSLGSHNYSHKPSVAIELTDVTQNKLRPITRTDGNNMQARPSGIVLMAFASRLHRILKSLNA
jgi:hypothetical protein